MSEKLICRKDSQIAQEMVEHNLSYAQKPFGPYLAGITAHVYADTFSHYGFSGVGSRWNKIDFDSIELLNLEPDIEPHIKAKSESFFEKFKEDAVENFRAITNRAMSSAAEVAALGHGEALTHPDRPYLQWQFDYEHPEKRSSGLRNNPATFLESCEKLHEMFCRFGKQHSGARLDDGRPFGVIRDTVSKILATQAPREGRIEAWEFAAESGALFAKPENILPYQGGQWAEEADMLREAEDSKAALDTSLFRFFQAAAMHRTYVLRDLLPSHGIVAD